MGGHIKKSGLSLPRSTEQDSWLEKNIERKGASLLDRGRKRDLPEVKVAYEKEGVEPEGF